MIFGGSGYIGSRLADYWLKQRSSDNVVIADIKPSPLAQYVSDSDKEIRLKYVHCDVRFPIDQGLTSEAPEWIFNFAAVHREPGHEAHEYFDTNIVGATNVTNFATAVCCKNIYFTSSISVYGPTSGPTDESAPMRPISPYGGSKFPAELIHQRWLAEDETRRLIIVRPGVVYGPHDPGNIGRMVDAIRKGYFAFPGRTDVYKSYGYIHGLLESIEFTIRSERRFVVYNYVETPTETLGAIAQHTKEALRSKSPIICIPSMILRPIATLVQLVLGDRNPVHPVRVRKASMETHIVPGTLISMGFPFRFDFKSSLDHWRAIEPERWHDLTPDKPEASPPVHHVAGSVEPSSKRN